MKMRFGFVAAVSLLAASLAAFGATKTWTGGGDGTSWTNTANWSGGIPPGTGDDVSITSGSGTTVVISATDVTVRSIQCTKGFTVSGRTLTLTGGASVFSGALWITNNATLTVSGVGSSATANGATLAADSDFYALGGGAIHLPNLKSVTNNVQNVTWRADGTGSLVDLSAITNLTLGQYRICYVQVYNGGTVDLRRVIAAAGAVQVDARDASSVVDLSGLAGRWTSLGSSELILHAQTGASILVPNVTQLEHAALRVDDTGTISTAQLVLLTNVTLTVDGCAPNFGHLTNIDDTDVYALAGGVARLTNVFRVNNGNQNVTWQADGDGSQVNLSQVTNVTLGFYRLLYVDGYDGGAVDLRRVKAAAGAVQVDARDEGTMVDLSGLSGRWTSLGSSELALHAQSGASIVMPNVTQLEHASLRVDDTATISTAQLNLVTNVTLTVEGSAPNFGHITNIDDTAVYALAGGVARLTNVFRVNNGNQNVTWQADGDGSLVDLSQVTNVTLGFYRLVYVDAYNGGVVDLRRVNMAAGAIHVDARGEGTVVNLSGLAGRWTSLGSSELVLHSQTGASILVPNVTQLEHASLRVDDTGTISTAQLTLLTNVMLTVDGSVPNFGRVTNIDDTDVYALAGGVARLTNVFRVKNDNQNVTWQADGAGSQVNLSQVTNVTLGYYRLLYVDGYNGGAVDLRRVKSAAGAVRVDARNASTVVDLSGLTGRWTSLGSSELALHAQSGASIVIPNVTQLEHALLQVDDTGTISTAQLNLLTNVTLTVDGSAPNFGHVTNIDDTEVYALAGGVARLTNVVRVSNGNQNATWQASGSGSLVDLSAVTSITVGYYRVLYVEALSGGKVDLRRLTSLSTGAVQMTADGTGSVIDLTALSGFVSTGSSSSSLTARNSGTILLNNQAFLLANVAINIPPGNPVLPATLIASPNLTLYGQPWHSYWIESRDTRSVSNVWEFEARVPMTTAFQPILPAPGANTEYRVWDFIADPPVLDLFPAAGRQTRCVIYDAPGKTNQLLSATSIAPGTVWQPGATTIMTNAFRILAPTAATDPVRFYRAKRR
jgi:hypothetical protein